MAGQVKYFFAFLLVFHVSLVSCRHDYQQYFSQDIKDESSTESSPPSTTGISTSKSSGISISEVLYPENVISPKANSYSFSDNNVYEKPVQSAYSSGEDKTNPANGIIIGCSIAAILIVGCIVVGCIRCLCCCCCGRKADPHHITNINIPYQPTTNMIQPQIPQAFTQPNQQQFQYSSPQPLMQQNPMQPMDQQRLLMPQEYSNPETLPPPYPTKC